ncbi:hypothetical protein FMK57_24105 [Klebsiella oxytoca]|nr:hypothetical protein [Klebsiella oxytoca]
MDLHDRLRIVFAEARQNWWAFAYDMHLHENHYIKRAGVAGIRARGRWEKTDQDLNLGIIFFTVVNSFKSCLL